jgi:hypothetical protein
VAFIGIAAIVAGNGAAPPPTAGAVAGETDAVPAATKGAGKPTARPLIAPEVAVEASSSPADVPDAGEAEPGDAPPIDDLTGYRWPIANARLTLPFGATPWGGWLVDG